MTISTFGMILGYVFFDVYIFLLCFFLIFMVLVGPRGGDRA